MHIKVKLVDKFLYNPQFSFFPDWGIIHTAMIMCTCNDFTGNQSKESTRHLLYIPNLRHSMSCTTIFFHKVHKIWDDTRNVSQNVIIDSRILILCYIFLIFSKVKKMLNKKIWRDGMSLLHNMQWCLSISKSYFKCSQVINTNSKTRKHYYKMLCIFKKMLRLWLSFHIFSAMLSSCSDMTNSLHYILKHHVVSKDLKLQYIQGNFPSSIDISVTHRHKTS